MPHIVLSDVHQQLCGTTDSLGVNCIGAMATIRKLIICTFFGNRFYNTAAVYSCIFLAGAAQRSDSATA